jgi:hypothetical protein
MREKENDMSLPNIRLVDAQTLSKLQNGQGGYCLDRAEESIKKKPKMAGQLHAFFKPNGVFCVPVWREGGVLHYGTPGDTFPKS